MSSSASYIMAKKPYRATVPLRWRNWNAAWSLRTSRRKRSSAIWTGSRFSRFLCSNITSGSAHEAKKMFLSSHINRVAIRIHFHADPDPSFHFNSAIFWVKSTTTFFFTSFKIKKFTIFCYLWLQKKVGQQIFSPFSFVAAVLWFEMDKNQDPG